MTLAVALEHRERGLALLPLGKKSKEPNHRVLCEVHGSARWTPLRSRPASAEQVRAWHDVDPQTNVGVILGEASGGLVIADLDRSAIGVTHPPTPVVRTARGYHVHLTSGQRLSTQVFPWGELRGDGSYALLPDSVHPSGTAYFYVVSHDDVEAASVNELRLADKRVTLKEEVAERYRGTSYEMPAYPSGVLLEELATDERAVRQMLRALGIGADLSQAFCCILPGHAEHAPSASVYRDPTTGLFLYRDWHARDGIKWLPLSWVRASLAYRRVVRLAEPESARWYLRLFYDAGLARPERVDLPRLPSKSRKSLRRVYEGFRLLIGLRWLREPGSSTPFTRTFAAAWCGVGERQAGEAIVDLMRLGVVEKVGEYGAGPRPMSLFMPGAGRPKRRRGG